MEDHEGQKRQLGDAIKKARKARGMTQTELGDLLGSGQSAVSAWEIGQNTPTALDLMAMQRLLGVNFGSEETPPETAYRIGYAMREFDEMREIGERLAQKATDAAAKLGGAAMPRVSVEDAEAGFAGLKAAEARDGAARRKGRRRAG